MVRYPFDTLTALSNVEGLAEGLAMTDPRCSRAFYKTLKLQG